jgi:hypothetical protein
VRISRRSGFTHEVSLAFLCDIAARAQSRREKQARIALR